MIDGNDSNDGGVEIGARIIVCPTPDDVTVAAAERVIALAAQGIAAAGRFVWALAGGGTPRALYGLLATPPYAARIDWSRVHICWGDERCVPPDHPDSNYRMAAETLLGHVPIPAANIHRVRGEDDPRASAATYERELRQLFPAARARFDLVLLGMGNDGHTASLFPGLTAVRETQRWVVAEDVPAMGMWRVTLTPAAINAAASVLFQITGSEKAAMVLQILEGPRRPEVLPAQVVAPVGGELTWLLDAGAAGALTRTVQRRPHA